MKVLHLRCRFFIYHYPQDPQLFCHEVVMWKRLTHPNVLPLLGITLDPPQLISSWMPGGDLLEFIKNPDADRVALVGVPPPCLLHAHPHYQLSDAAKGLFYLHSCNMVHGDFKGVCDCSKLHSATVLTPNKANILVDDSGHARIADFGLAEITQNLQDVCNHVGWRNPLDESRALRSSEVWYEKESPDQEIGLLCTGDGDVRNPQWGGSIRPTSRGCRDYEDPGRRFS